MNAPRDSTSASLAARFGGAKAKVEIFVGLAAAGAGILLGDWVMGHPTAEIDWGLAAGALGLFVLGGYLTLAGHRSHIYRSNIELETRLVERFSSNAPR
jgi:hypothetical protein